MAGRQLTESDMTHCGRHSYYKPARRTIPDVTPRIPIADTLLRANRFGSLSDARC